MALSFAMHWIEDNDLATLTNYGEFLEKFPPTLAGRGRRRHVLVVRPTAWNAGDRTAAAMAARPAGTSEWRKPLRDCARLPARRHRAACGDARRRRCSSNLWAARDAYIQVVLDRSAGMPSTAFSPRMPNARSPPDERTTVLELMELERHTQLMYTSCGWFFDEISGIETVQIIAYAGRVIQLACELLRRRSGNPDRGPSSCASWPRRTPNVVDPVFKDGSEVYTQYITGMKIGLEQVGAHYAISSVFRNYPEDGELFCFDPAPRRPRDLHLRPREGRAGPRPHHLLASRRRTEEICYAVLHLGDQNLSAAVRRYHLSRRGRSLHQAFSADVRRGHPQGQSAGGDPADRPLLLANQASRSLRQPFHTSR